MSPTLMSRFVGKDASTHKESPKPLKVGAVPSTGCVSAALMVYIFRMASTLIA